jgi:hypothetical protein
MVPTFERGMTMAIQFKLLADGGFVAGDTETGRTSYAYPTSPHATMARTMPERIAAEMIASANRVSGDTADYDARMWAKMAPSVEEAWHNRVEVDRETAYGESVRLSRSIRVF